MTTLLERERQRSKLVFEVSGYGRLADGWDGQSSLAPRRATLNCALEFIRLLPSDIPLPRSMMDANGNAGLYWNYSKNYIDVEFNEASQISILAVAKKQPGPDQWSVMTGLTEITPQFFDTYFAGLRRELAHGS